ncbi:MAG: YbdD/YjiX family protein [Gemmatimonadetes bacterium]|nr:YbdD/YjiX family protein [Gemmatimonadota bacterium]MCC6770341.1 YbdD/YjiX family protein [Gemmatimonadaceae bacterium]
MNWSSSILARIARATRTLNRIIGAPDYDTYLSHARTCHPDAALMTRDEFVRQRLEDRYSRPGARCC